ncbi:MULTISPECIES: hypothetical protein [unclassified Chryseobacterium]|nr:MULTISPECIES: hypothetical protein [unclassified Chryseobacterium]
MLPKIPFQKTYIKNLLTNVNSYNFTNTYNFTGKENTTVTYLS